MDKDLTTTSYYKDKTILVTGGLGYIGSALVRVLNKISCKIMIITQPNSSIVNFGSSYADISVIEEDIRQKGIWNKVLNQVDIVFHLAGQTSSKAADDDPIMDINTNLLPVVNMVTACKEKNLSPKIIFSGTVTQVGFTDKYPISEAMRDLPVTVYDINKLAAEKYLQFYSNNMGRDAVTLRLANVYGPGLSSSSADRGVLNLMIKKALAGELLTVYGDGSFIRDYIYIEDVIEAFLIAGAYVESISGNYYLIGSGIAHSIKQTVEIVRDKVSQKVHRSIDIKFIPPPRNMSKIEYRHFVADTTRFNSATNWQARTSLSEGITKTIEYFINQN